MDERQEPTKTELEDAGQQRLDLPMPHQWDRRNYVHAINRDDGLFTMHEFELESMPR